MAADDLGRLVTLDALGAEVPRDHMTRRVEHEDGVVTDALDEETEALVGLVVDPAPVRHPSHGTRFFPTGRR